MSKEKRIAWFSAGITSAVAGKIALEIYGDIEFYYIETGSAHPDNARFIRDCENWYGQEIHTLQNAKGYKDHFHVIEKERYVNGPDGAKCTTVLKKEVRLRLEASFEPSLFTDEVLVGQVFGYEYERKQINRAIRFLQQYPSSKGLMPLIEKGINKDQCAAILIKAGIELPTMYKLGYENNNCIGCVKGGMGYWNAIRRDFPEIFQQMAEAERKIGHSCIKGRFLDTLLPGEGKELRPVAPACGPFCEIEFEDMEDKNLEAVLNKKISIYEAAKL